MSDEYWDHPSRRETKRLLDLGDAGAILDELQQGSTEWDDAREALDHLVRGAQEETAAATVADPMTPERLAEIRAREQAALSPTWTVVRDDHGSKGREIAIWAEEPSGYGYVTENLGTIRDADAEFIAHARQDVPALLAEVERLRAELTQVTTATTYLQGPEECLERECEEYFDDDGNERPGVEYCSHLKAKRLTVDEHLAAKAERDRLAEQVRVLALGADPLCAYHADHETPGCDGCVHASTVRTARAALDGTEAGR